MAGAGIAAGGFLMTAKGYGHEPAGGECSR
jgi:hypothetical protein